VLCETLPVQAVAAIGQEGHQEAEGQQAEGLRRRKVL
jgi:hypothetical protein